MEPITGKKLIDLIPQKPPFVLISSLNEVSENNCITTFVFTAAHVLCQNGELTSAGLMENIAQTAAAKMGYECFLEGKKIPIGFIGDVRDFIFTRLPKAGEELTTEITIENKIFDVTIMSGKVMVDGKEIASCKMKIFVEPEPVQTVQTLPL
jgi:predicted hotdog family 3-hydroxylacyl-ACP dehydratase